MSSIHNQPNLTPGPDTVNPNIYRKFLVKNPVLTCLALSALLFLPSRSFASFLLMGRILSVHPYGAQDAVRNPALIVWQKMDDEIGLLLDYQTDMSSSLIIRNSGSIASPSVTSFNSGAFRVSYIGRINAFALGIDAYAEYQNSNVHQQSYSTSNGFDTLGKGPATNTNLVTTLTISAGIAVNAQNSLGIQATTAYVRSTDTRKSNYIQLSPFPVLFKETNKSFQEQVVTSPGIGYLGKIENTEVGLMINAGRLSWERDISERETYSLGAAGAAFNIEEKAKGEIPFSFSYSLGPGLIAGAYTRPTEVLGIGLELEFTIPVNFKKRVLFPLGKFFYIGNKKLNVENKISNNPFVSLRGGFEFFVLPGTVLSIGGGLEYADTYSRTYGRQLMQLITGVLRFSHKIMSVYGTAGLDFMLSRRNILTVGASVGYNTVYDEQENLQYQFPGFNLGLFRNSTKLKSMSLDLLIMMSFGF
jgi:hypothetical protein